MASQATHVYKFGGTSVATAERIRRVVSLVQSEPSDARRVVVVSALGGVTDQLLAAINEALARTGEHQSVLDEIRHRHVEALQALVDEADREMVCNQLTDWWEELCELVDGIYLLRECTGRTRDAIIGMGEQASAVLVAAALRAAGTDVAALDATRLICTDAAFGEANVQFEETYQRIQVCFTDLPPAQVAVVTGFVAATERDVKTTLGRSGSDYTATLFAAALNAERVVIWTDVDGVLSADPRLVPDAFSLPQLSYQEASELAYFGAKVLHPRTMRPLQERGIPLRIKNTINPEAPGTLISRDVTQAEGYVKAITTIRGVAVVMLEGAGMIGVHGISARAFGALADAQINVLMISQASSEQNICFVVRDHPAEAAVNALRSTFKRERVRGDVSRISAQGGCAVVSAVGDRMRKRTGLAGRMFSTLGRSGVNVLAIAQGASETNISAVVLDAEVKQAVRALHEAFALGRDRAHVFLIGRGVVGTALLRMLDRQAPVLRERLNLNLQLVGLANTRKMVWDIEGIPFSDAAARLDAADRPMDLEAILEKLAPSRLDRLIVVDATASDIVARRYPELLRENVAVVTPNKRANTQNQTFYDTLQQAERTHQVPYLYKTTVCAGLPVISTLRDLRDAGDRIERIEGVFSGTLSFIFNQLAEGTPFSEAVRKARAQGYTEPDPRDDLNGEDVARKLLILAREMDLSVERADVAVQSLVPDELLDVSTDVFMDRLAQMDASWTERMAAAADEGKRLQYVGHVAPDRISVRVRAVDPASPFAHLRGTANMVVYTTERYHDVPLVVQGPGAGPEVTAAGVLANLIQAARRVA